MIKVSTDMPKHFPDEKQEESVFEHFSKQEISLEEAAKLMDMSEQDFLHTYYAYEKRKDCHIELQN